MNNRKEQRKEINKPKRIERKWLRKNRRIINISINNIKKTLIIARKEQRMLSKKQRRNRGKIKEEKKKRLGKAKEH